jgi:hypothetical protein
VTETNPNWIVSPASSVMTVAGERTQERLLAPTTGTSYALAVRLVASKYKESPEQDIADLQGRIFGRGARAESVNLSDQYELCSKGRFRIQPSVNGQVRATGRTMSEFSPCLTPKSNPSYDREL